MHLSLHVSGDADPATAWERYADLDAWTQWSPQIQRVDTGPVRDVGGSDDADDDTDGEQEALDEGAPAPPPPGTDPAPRRITPGLRGVVIGPVGVQVPFEVLEVDEAAMTWTWRVRAVLAELTLEHSVTPEGGGCRTDLTIIGPVPLVVGYAPVARFALTRLVRP
ncbi:polyketide cyclase/dehydrase/lipid transport protein [Humibacillus xanthopallidus]|uniref:Polyketide cyclase/dehydrase/lipid transport protein n=1 Tax=Humibacillus xanthopallidus TaxID=412689 RepID=A0A543PNK9_9MICO|nr:SRPBCC family protein [Humibacillus xanthopallidus]TQN45668.1 polyketide cyclase/dehydrase/lipid transport protein [Humibacillus xanthopallidus]